MNIKLLNKHHLEFLSLKGVCTCSSESTLVKMPHCWKSRVTAHLGVYSIWRVKIRLFVFVMISRLFIAALWSPEGKGWPFGSCLWCLLWFCNFPIWYSGQMWYLIVLIPDLCCLSYFTCSQREIMEMQNLPTFNAWAKLYGRTRILWNLS